MATVGKYRAKLGWIGLAITLSSLLLCRDVTLAGDPDDPGKGFDYVFYGFSPPFPNPGPGNRAMLLLDIDDAGSPRRNPQGPRFKFLAANTVASGRLDVQTVKPTSSRLIGIQTDPERFILSFQGIADQGNVFIQGDALLEADGLHYLRAVVDVVHNGARIRYLANCVFANCDAP